MAGSGDVWAMIGLVYVEAVGAVAWSDGEAVHVAALARVGARNNSKAMSKAMST